MNDASLAEDITQNVFTLAVDRLDNFQWQGYSFGAWLFQFARNLINRELEYRQNHPEVSWNLEKHDKESPGDETQLDEITDQAILVFCVTKLEAQRREVFQTYYWSGLKMKEIALVMDLNISVIKNHLTRGVCSFGIAFRKMVCSRGYPNQKFS